MVKAIWIFAFFFAASCSCTCLAESQGTVCLGQNFAKVFDEHTSRLYLRINNSPNIYFSEPYQGPRMVASNLGIHDKHLVQVFFDNEVVHSWLLSFDKLRTTRVVIWRSAGAWRMEPGDELSCR